MAVVSAPGLVEKSYLVLILFVLNALPFLLGTQPAVLNSLKNIESLQGDPNKQILLLVLYAVGAILLFWRVGLKRAFQLGAPLLLLIVICFASIAWAAVPGVVFRRVIALLGTIAVGVYAGTRFDLQEMTSIALHVIGLVLLASLLLAIIDPSLGFDPEGRMRGLFADKNAFGNMAALGIVALAATHTEARHMGTKHFVERIAVAVVSILCLQLSQSASPLPSLAMAIVVLLLARVPSSPRNVAFGFIAAAAIILIVGAIALAFNGGSPAALFGRDPTLSGRTLIWHFSWRSYLEHPWLGYGYGAFWTSYSPAAQFWSFYNMNVPNAHNGYLQLLVDVGPLGLALFLVTLFLFIGRGLKLLIEIRQPYLVWVAAFTSYFLCLNLVESRLWAQNDFMTAMFVAMVVQVNGLSRISSVSSRAMLAWDSLHLHSSPPLPRKPMHESA
jgi:O-antigen ligase